MKSTLLLISMLSWAAVVSAQLKKNSTQPQQVAKDLGVLRQVPSTPASSSLIEYGDTLYINDFSDSTVFTQITDPGSQWVFGTEATVGHSYDALFDPFNSTTAANGYALFDSDGYGASIFSDASLTVGPINLSTATAPISLNFEQYYSRFQDSALVQVSSDGINFVTVGDNLDVPQVTGGFLTDNPDLETIVISQYAGQSTVYVRFKYVANYAWAWMIDDITITEITLTANDLGIANAWSHNNLTQFGYAQIPLSQADTVGFTAFVANDGGVAQSYTVNYSIRLNGNVVSSGTASSDGAATSLGSDTLHYTTNFVPSVTGLYTIDLSLSPALGADPTPGNDTASRSFEITEFLYSPVGPDLTQLGGTGYSGATSPYNAWKIGQLFTVAAEQFLKNIEISVFKPAAFTGTQDFLIEVYDASGALDGNSIPLAIGDYQMTENTSNTEWSTVVVDELLLDPTKTYLAVVGYADTDKQFYMNATNEDGDEGTRIFGPFGADNAIDWYRGADMTPAIRLNFAIDIGFEDKSNLAALSVSPNPANDLVHVVLPFTNPDSYLMNLMDINGRVVYSKTQTSKVASVTDVVSLTNFANGIYTLQVVTSTGVASAKVVVAH